jgi:hypothetical protein
MARWLWLAGGNELCRALPFPKAHGKVLCRVKMRRVPFAVRSSKMRTAKFLSLSCAKRRIR